MSVSDLNRDSKAPCWDDSSHYINCKSFAITFVCTVA